VREGGRRKRGEGGRVAGRKGGKEGWWVGRRKEDERREEERRKRKERGKEMGGGSEGEREGRRVKGEFLVVSCQYFRKRLSAYPLCPGLAMTQIELEKIADTFDTNRDGMINLNEIMAVVKGTKRTRGMPERSLSDAEKIDHEVCLQLPILFQCHSLIPNHTSPMVSFSNHTSPIVSFSNHTSPIVSFSNHTSPIVSFPNCMSSVVSFSNHITNSLILKPHTPIVSFSNHTHP